MCKRVISQKVIMKNERLKMMAESNFGSTSINHRKLKPKQSCHFLILNCEQAALLCAVEFIFLYNVRK